MEAPQQLCHWCRKVMRPAKEVGDTHPDARTVDHVKCKAECSSKLEYIKPDNQVLACHACNERRNREYLKANPIPRHDGWWIEERNRKLAITENSRNFKRKIGSLYYPQNLVTKTGEQENRLVAPVYYHTHY